MKLCGIDINCCSESFLIDSILAESKDSYTLITVNAEAVVRSQRNARLRNFINDNLASIDGQITLWLFRTLYPTSKVKKVAGSDLIYSIPEYAERNNLRVFLLGGKEEGNERAVERLKEKFPDLTIAGYSPKYHPYPFPKEMDDKITKMLLDFKPDILFVGFGMGKQEFWEQDNQPMLYANGCRLIIGCGGSFEFVSGYIKRAPRFIQNIGLESVWRLINEFKWFRIKRILISFEIFYYYFKHHILRVSRKETPAKAMD